MTTKTIAVSKKSLTNYAELLKRVREAFAGGEGMGVSGYGVSAYHL
jgi:hypothetical protein